LKSKAAEKREAKQEEKMDNLIEKFMNSISSSSNPQPE